MIYGDPGIGKTTLIGTGGSAFKTLIIRPPTDHTDPIVGSGCQETIVRDWEQIWEVLEYLRHEGSVWDWVWLDSISLMQDFGLDDVYDGILDRKGPVGSLARAAREQFGPDQGEYRVNMWRLEQWIRHTVGAADFNFGVTAHPFWYEPKDDDIEPYLMLDLHRSGEEHRMEVEGVHRRHRLAGEGQSYSCRSEEAGRNQSQRQGGCRHRSIR
jgi:hypothetical protein